ncbi:MAG: hypothetical protein ABSG58_08500 [Acidimicrobiales bacterium]
MAPDLAYASMGGGLARERRRVQRDYVLSATLEVLGHATSPAAHVEYPTGHETRRLTLR